MNTHLHRTKLSGDTALDRDPQFKAKLYLGRQHRDRFHHYQVLRYLAAMESDSDRGLKIPAEARLALAQCGVFLTASETFLLGEFIGKGSTPDDTSIKMVNSKYPCYNGRLPLRVMSMAKSLSAGG